MSLSTLTSKGQVTIPKPVRDSLRLHTGDKIEFVVTSSGEAVMRPVTKAVDDVYGTLWSADRKSHSIAEMDAGIRKRLRSRRR